MIGQTPWTTDEAAAMLDCSRGHTTARIEAFGGKIDMVAEALAEGMKKPRPDRIASAVVSLLSIGGRIAQVDPDGLNHFIRQRLEGQPLATGNGQLATGDG